VARREVALDPAVASILGPSSQPPSNGRGKKTPHERERRGRKLSLTLPSDAWVDVVYAEARRWGALRPADVVVYALARMMAGFEEGEARPQGEARPYYRAGEGLALPWEPE